MNDMTKDIVKSTLNLITPNVSKLVFEDIGKIRKETFKKPSETHENTDDDSQEFHKSTRSMVAESLNEVREREIDKTYNEERRKTDKPDSSGLSSSSAITEPYFKNSKRKTAYSYRSNVSKRKAKDPLGSSLRMLTKQQATTNKLLKTQLKASIEMQRQSSSAILSSMAEIKAFQQEVTLSFYNDVSEKLTGIANTMSSIGRIYSTDVQDSYKTDRERFMAELQSNGLMFNMFGKIFKENLSDGKLLEGVIGENKKVVEEFKKGLVNIFTGIDKETGEVKEGFFGKAGNFIGKTVKQVKGLDDLVGSMPYNMQYMLNGMKNGTKMKVKLFGNEFDLGKLAGNAFGKDMSVKKNLSANRYEKGPMAYNGLANRAITNVIPSLLSKILSTLNGREEIIYDYEKGEFADKSAIRAERDRRLQNTVKQNMSGDISRILGENASEEDKKKLETLFHNMAMEGKTISDYKGPLTDDAKLDKKLQEYYSKMENKGSLNRNIFRTSVDMNQFYTKFAKDLAGQMANDYGNDIYSKDRRQTAKDNAEILEADLENRSGMSFSGKIFDIIGGLSSKISGKVGGTEPSSLGSEIEKTIKSVFGEETSPSATVLTNPRSVLSTQPAESRNADVIAFLQARANPDSINVFIKGGILDSIKNIVRTREEAVVDRNAGFKENQSKMLLEAQEDAQERAELMATSDRLASEQESRIASFETRRDNLLNEMETKIKTGFNTILERTGLKDKFNQVKMGIGKRLASSRLGKTGIGKVLGKAFSSPQQVENAGMTPVYVMGSAIASSGGLGMDILNEQQGKLDLAKAKDFLLRGQGKAGSLLSSLGGKLAGKSGLLGKAGGFLAGTGGKLSSLALASRAKNAQSAMDSGLGTELKKKVAKDAGGVGKVTELAQNGTTTGDAVKSTARNIGSKALDVGKSVGGTMVKGAGKLASKAGSALSSLATAKTGSKLGTIAGGAGTLLSGGGSALTSMGDKLNPEAEADKKIADMKVANATRRELMKDKMETAREKLKDMWANKNEIMRSGIEKAQTMAREAKKTVMELVGTAKREKMKDIGEKIMGGVRKVWDTVREGAKTGIEVAGSGIKAALTAISGVPGLGTALAIAGGVAGTALLGIAAMALVKKLSQPSDKPQGGVPSIDIGKLIGGGKEAKQAEKTAKKQSKDALKAQKENKSPFGEFAFTPDGDTTNGQGQEITSDGNGIMTNPLGSLMNLISTKKKTSNNISKPMASNVKSSTEKEDNDSTAESTKRLSVLQVKLKGNYFHSLFTE